MTTEDGSRPDGGPTDAARPLGTAEEFLSPELLGLIEAVRVAARRIVAGAAPRRVALDIEAVHDFRVALRRLRTLLRPARRIYGKKRLQRIADELRLYADATSALRDEEVLRETLASLSLADEVRPAVDRWIARRARKERACRAEVTRLLAGGEAAPGQGAGAPGRSRRALLAPERGAPPEPASPSPELEPCLARLASRLAHPKRKRLSAEDLARAAIDEALADVRTLATADPSDGPAMHALRIRFKRLRYSAEAFVPVLRDQATQIAKAASRMQRRLGQLHDVDEASLRMARAWGLSPVERDAVLAALVAERERLVGKVAAELGRELEALAAAWPVELPLVDN